MFTRFSRPRARFLFARHAVVRPVDGRAMLMFRAANAPQNVVQEASAKLRMIRDEVTREGLELRRSGASFVLSLSGTDETTGHTLMARADYSGTAILWNKAFRDVLDVTEEGVVFFDYTLFHEVEDLPE
jgi:inward rectifier potassium channel